MVISTAQQNQSPCWRGRRVINVHPFILEGLTIKLCIKASAALPVKLPSTPRAYWYSPQIFKQDKVGTVWNGSLVHLAFLKDSNDLAMISSACPLHFVIAEFDFG